MMKMVLLFILTLQPAGWAANLVDVKNYQEEGRFVSEMVFDETVSSEKLGVEYINETIQIDVPGATVPDGKMHRTVSDPMVRSTYTYQVNGDTLRNRIIYKGVPADTFKDKVELVSGDKTLKIIIGDKPAPVAVAKKEIVADPPKKLGDIKTAKATIDQEELEAKKLLEEVEQEIAADLEAHKEEESMPLVLGTPEIKEAEANPYFRMLVSLGIVGVIGLFSLLVLRRWKKNSPLANNNTQIKLLTQHPLGPKKSLAIIRVAGESILIGVTDHNISMIKSLSLLDEDIPEEVPKDFSGVLGKLWERDAKTAKPSRAERRKAKKSEKGDDDFSIEGIKDIVSSRLKDMRPIE